MISIIPVLPSTNDSVHFSCAVKNIMGSEPAQKDNLLSSSPLEEGNVGYFFLWT